MPAGSYFSASPGACQIFTRFQSASSSSARIMGMPVRTPWPISDRLQVRVTVPSRAMRTKTFGAADSNSPARARNARGTRCEPITSAVAAPVEAISARRLRLVIPGTSHLPSGRLDGGKYALIRTATTYVSLHRIDDLLVRRLGIGAEQCRCLHNLAGLAITALGNVVLPPRELDGVIALGVQPLDCRNLSSLCRCDRRSEEHTSELQSR